ncbi:MAG TPA: argininosuccinate lyase [Kiritimatiellia bacterium]|nr:argininosuccinate lyase [Kiritimatiellia bacterium]
MATPDAKSKPRSTTVGAIDPEVLAFTAGRDVVLDQALVEVDCLGTAAHVVMLSRIPVKPPVMTKADARRVLVELRAIVERARAGRFEILIEDQDVHLAVERTLTAALGAVGKRVHTARSRNDQVALDLRLHARASLLETIGEAAALAATLLAFARRHVAVPMVGRTHMQPGMPSSVGLWASAFAEELADGMELLVALYHLNNRSPLGSAASYGVPLPIDRALVARLLGFAAPAHNVLYANQGRGRLESLVLDGMSQVMLTLSKLAQDLMLFTMPEFAYFTLPAAYCTGSSIMPQKKNPDVLELVRAKSARVRAAASGVYDLLRGLPSGYNRDLQEAKEPYLEGLATTRACLRVMNGLMAGTQVNRDALVRGFTPDVFATDRALELVAAGVPFRDAYHQVKNNLDELAGTDPRAAIRKKTHLGAPLGLDFPLMQRRVQTPLRFARAEQRRLAACMDRLLWHPSCL